MLGPFATVSRRTPPVLHCHSPGVATVTRRLRIDVHNNIDNNDNAWQRGPLWPHGMGPIKEAFGGLLLSPPCDVMWCVQVGRISWAATSTGCSTTHACMSSADIPDRSVRSGLAVRDNRPRLSAMTSAHLLPLHHRIFQLLLLLRSFFCSQHLGLSFVAFYTALDLIKHAYMLYSSYRKSSKIFKEDKRWQ